MRHGSELNPPNRFEQTRREPDLEHVEWDQEYMRTLTHRKIEYIADASKSIISENRSPDIPFRFSLNPYRGCIHGCSYCYARSTHEYLGFNAGLDFETKIVVKHNAAAMFREFLAKESWQPEPIMFSGVTDCYQPAEREFRMTWQCLEVAWECRQPVSIITKNALITRDRDLLKQLAASRLVNVFLSIPTLQPELAREMEPRTSIPQARLRAITMLAEVGVPVGVMVSPVIPGLNDSEIPAILAAAADAGVMTASSTLLRLPLTVEPVFREWLERTQPLKAERVLGLIRNPRGGELSSSNWGERMTGQGEIAEQIAKMFHLFREKHGLQQPMPPHDCNQFRSPRTGPKQLELF